MRLDIKENMIDILIIAIHGINNLKKNNNLSMYTLQELQEYETEITNLLKNIRGKVD